jgi:D-glycero-D-manno-heptose 1,7-bisphosphate phosphatase
MPVPKQSFINLKIDKSWTLFLDRDGVINRKIDGDYVRNLNQFEWLPGIHDSIRQLSLVFGKIIIVTNQQGVGKGLMTHEEVNTIHEHIKNLVAEKGGKIDAIYYAPELKSENSDLRKPNIGMAHLAKNDFPGIDFSKSIMVGDTMSDMQFGKKAGMITVFITNVKLPPESLNLIDLHFEDVAAFAVYIQNPGS